LSPRSAETGITPATSMPASSANASSDARTAAYAAPGSATASSLLIANTMLGTRNNCASSACRRVCASSLTGSPGCEVSSFVMSTSTTAASLPAAAVTMLRVYCSCPGASAMMNLRVRVAK